MMKFLSDDLILKAKAMMGKSVKKFVKRRPKIAGYMGTTEVSEVKKSPKRITARFNNEMDWKLDINIDDRKSDNALYGKVVVIRPSSPMRSPEQQKDIAEKMHSRHNAKEEKRLKLKDEIRNAENQKCTFQPNIHKYESKRIRVFDPSKEDPVVNRLVVKS